MCYWNGDSRSVLSTYGGVSTVSGWCTWKPCVLSFKTYGFWGVILARIDCRSERVIGTYVPGLGNRMGEAHGGVY